MPAAASPGTGPSGTGPSGRRSDAGTARFTGRDITGLVLAGVGILAEVALHSGAGPAPAAGALAGIVTWLALTGRGDFAPPPGR